MGQLSDFLSIHSSIYWILLHAKHHTIVEFLVILSGLVLFLNYECNTYSW